MFVIESAIAKAADALKVDASMIQEINLIETGDEFPYGQKAESEAKVCWSKAEEIYELEKARKEIEIFNRENKLLKKGLALMPVCFGISFTKTMMNSARSLVHIYSDGSVNISTAAVEMGQGVNTKILQVAESVFSIQASRIKINSTNTFRIANTAPTAASAAADLNGKATMLACESLVFRLKAVAAEDLKCKIDQVSLHNEKVFVDGKDSGYDWIKMVMSAFTKRVSLSEHAHYSTPVIHFDLQKEKGHPFAYHVYGTAIITVTVNCLLGTYTFDSVKVVHDYGKSMNTIIDRGQTEGGIVQGIGWMTMEELIYDSKGILKSNALSTYKVPDIYSVPSEIDIHFLETENNNLAVFNSKAVGEPPLMYAIGAFFALRNAIRSFNPSAEVAFNAPMTPEKVLLNLYQRRAG
jgi:xanthine dehydrogenase large subunit